MTDQTRDEVTRYDRLGPIARALVDDYDEIDLAAMLVTAQDELAALRAVSGGYCPACGRGDAGPTVDDWEQQKQRADQAEAKIADYENRITWHTSCQSCARILDSSIHETHRADRAENAIRQARSLHRESCPFARGKVGRTAFTCGMCDALDPPAPAATQATEHEKTTRVFAALHHSAEQDVTRVQALYEQWVKAGPPPLGTPTSRWWDRRLAELHAAIPPPTNQPEHHTGTTPANQTAPYDQTNRPDPHRA